MPAHFSRIATIQWCMGYLALEETTDIQCKRRQVCELRRLHYTIKMFEAIFFISVACLSCMWHITIFKECFQQNQSISLLLTLYHLIFSLEATFRVHLTHDILVPVLSLQRPTNNIFFEVWCFCYPTHLPLEEFFSSMDMVEAT